MTEHTPVESTLNRVAGRLIGMRRDLLWSARVSLADCRIELELMTRDRDALLVDLEDARSDITALVKLHREILDESGALLTVLKAFPEIETQEIDGSPEWSDWCVWQNKVALWMRIRKDTITKAKGQEP